ncbi:28S ribosomal protein S18c, mitochondrial [Eublepharis macularius]|uniref:Small ribosomal subunit protein bS18m n=1 Tax=Eublepharis macularius TaxID=481883 RepID=A0AA97JXN7_EUBMA|nr:28S ribosomal protein S18c, mitochondrial [Eublepharis macularius]
MVFLRRKCGGGGNMAAVDGFFAPVRGWGKLCCILASAGKNSSRSFGAVATWRQQCSSHNEQVSSKPDMPELMDNPYKEPPKKCILCGTHVDYKNVQLLSQFISPYTGHILGMRVTGLCPKKQLEVSKAIKRAQKIGFMPVTYKDPTFLSDPKICNIKYPD